METVAGPSAQDDVELHLLTDWGERDPNRTRRAGIASILGHVALIAILFSLPESFTRLPPRPRPAPRITPLIAPLREVTQPEPNKGPISKEITTEALLPRPRIQIPPSRRSTTRPAAQQPGTPRPAPPRPPAVLPEPPRLQAGGSPAPPPELQAQTPALAQPAPQIELQEKPKLALETPGGPPPAPKPGAGGLIPPNPSVSEAIRSVARGSAGGGLMVGDVGPSGLGGLGDGLNLPPSPGKAASNLELLSDPMGVDFRPYLIRILSTVRRNWFAVMPESAKMGRRGRVTIQFAIDRNGSVPKLVIVSGSGAEALDRAAVAGISASNPFPPLPTDFRGGTIRLQFNFAYNARN